MQNKGEKLQQQQYNNKKKYLFFSDYKIFINFVYSTAGYPVRSIQNPFVFV